MRQICELRAGEYVEVRSKEEILETLDDNGQLDGLPFMPEMLAHCGQRFRVFKRAHKTCDPPNGLCGRRMSSAVHLEDARCNGAAHGGCQARCLIFWKEAWLKRIDGSAEPEAIPRRRAGNELRLSGRGGCSESALLAGTRQRGATDEPVFVCQSTRLSQATRPWRWWDVRQYVEDYTSGNVRLSQIVAVVAFFLYEQIASAGVGLGSAMRWAYDVVQKRRGGAPYPLRSGRIPRGERTPSARLELQPGELVRVRCYDEILATLDEDWHNRGMYFDAEMVEYCGNTHRVLGRISRIINEKTGKMQVLKNECIVLDGVVCRARYAKYRRFCSRSIYPYWREIWLERVGAAAVTSATRE